MMKAALGNTLGFITRLLPKWLVWCFVKRFIAGRTAEEALATAERLRRDGFAMSLNYLGEDVSDRLSVKHTAMNYRLLLGGIDYLKLSADIALKLSQFGILGDGVPDIVRGLGIDKVFEIMRIANCRGIHVWIDAERLRWREETWRFAARFVIVNPNIGICVQAYAEDAVTFVSDRIHDGWRGSIRVCKGAYREPGYRLLSGKGLDENFIKLCALVLSHNISLQVATHDELLISKLDRFCGPREYGFLLGVNPGLAQKLHDGGARVNIYAAYGKDFKGYGARRLKERPGYVLLPFRGFHVGAR